MLFHYKSLQIYICNIKIYIYFSFISKISIFLFTEIETSKDDTRDSLRVAVSMKMKGREKYRIL